MPGKPVPKPFLLPQLRAVTQKRVNLTAESSTASAVLALQAGTLSLRVCSTERRNTASPASISAPKKSPHGPVVLCTTRLQATGSPRPPGPSPGSDPTISRQRLGPLPLRPGDDQPLSSGPGPGSATDVSRAAPQGRSKQVKTPLLLLPFLFFACAASPGCGPTQLSSSSPAAASSLPTFASGSGSFRLRSKSEEAMCVSDTK